MLVATGGRPASGGAIAVAADLQRRFGGSVRVVTAAELVRPVATALAETIPPANIAAAIRRELQQDVRRQLARIRSADAWPVAVRSDHPASAILAEAEETEATLIVLGRARHPLIRRILHDDVAFHVASRSAVPVLAVPERTKSVGNRVVAAVDFTPASLAAARLAASVTRRGGRLTLLHLGPFLDDEPESTWTSIHRMGVTKRLAELRRELRPLTPARIETLVTGGNVADTVLAIARRQRADLVAIGLQDRGTVDRLILGTSVTRILRHVRAAVLLARAPTGAQ